MIDEKKHRTPILPQIPVLSDELNLFVGFHTGFQSNEKIVVAARQCHGFNLLVVRCNIIVLDTIFYLFVWDFSKLNEHFSIIQI